MARDAKKGRANLAKALQHCGVKTHPASGRPHTAAECQSGADRELARPEHGLGPFAARNAAGNIDGGGVAQLRATEAAARARRDAQLRELTGED